MNDRVYKKVSILKLEASWSVLFLQPHCPIGPLLELTHFRSWKSWENLGVWVSQVHQKQFVHFIVPIGSMYAIYGNIYHQYTPNVSIYTIHGSYGVWSHSSWSCFRFPSFRHTMSLTPAPQRLRRTTLPFWCFSHLATVDILTNGRTHGWSCFPQSMKETILTCPPMSFRFHDWPFKPPLFGRAVRKRDHVEKARLRVDQSEWHLGRRGHPTGLWRISGVATEIGWFNL